MAKRSNAKRMELHDLTTAKFLIGAKVIRVCGSSIEIQKNGKNFLITCHDEGSYSDWWEIDTKLLISATDLAKNPIITNVKQNGNTFQFVIFGLSRPIAEIKAKFHNDSDWDYGCTCSIYADNKELVCWHG